MSYRQSSFDPFAASAPTRPMRPFNWVQWVGIGLEVAAFGIMFWHVLVRLHLLPPPAAPIQYATLSALIGITLIGSRREPVPENEDPARRGRDRLWMTVSLTVLGLMALTLVGLDIWS